MSKNLGGKFMKLVFDEILNLFAYVYHRPYTTVIKKGEIILERSEVKFMNLETCVFEVESVAKIKSGLSITVREKKLPQTYRLKK